MIMMCLGRMVMVPLWLLLQNIPLLILRLCLSMLLLTWEDPNLFSYHQKVDDCLYIQYALEAWFKWYSLCWSCDWAKYWQMMVIIPMPWQDSEVQELSTYKCNIHIVDDLLIYLMACKDMSWSLLIGWSWANQGISLVDHFIWVHMSWLNWINMQCCLLWDVWMD